MKLATPAGNAITLDEDQKSLTLADQNGNKIVMDSEGIHIESAKATDIKAGTEAKFEAGTGAKIGAGTELKLEGGASAELSGGGSTKVTGAMVQIN